MTRSGWIKSGVGLGLLVGVGAAAYFLLSAGSPAADGLVVDPDDRAQVALGQRLYAVHCAACHGRNLEGEANWRKPLPDGSLRAPPHDRTGHTWHHPDQVLFAYTKLGGAKLMRGAVKSNMPGFEGTLSDREIAAILAFIKSRWPKEIRERQATMTEAYRKR